ncbi:MAG: Mitochondrial outer membrane protein iml2 [Pycnora praestabilis]|nr:MAG: Mitochondrial outer membrane protein iml2 [Pycnora praestabilis]
MMRMGSWLQSKGKSHNTSTQSLDSLDEPQYLEDAMRAVMHIMSDDVEAAEAELSHGNSAFHKLGKGMTAFIKATLGFEQEIMREASERLADAESTASTDQRRAQRDSHSYRSAIYPPGSEFALCHAESQLMSAVVGVLNESLTESIRGFYKLRKAFITLDGIMEAENKFFSARSLDSVKSNAGRSKESLVSNKSALSSKSVRGMPGGFADERHTESRPRAKQNLPVIQQPKTNGVKHADFSAIKNGHGHGDDDDDDFYDADETHEDARIPVTYAGHIDTSTPEKRLEDLTSGSAGNPADSLPNAPNGSSSVANMSGGIEPEVFANPIDIFIHSGASLCYGLLLVMISMIPPAFSKLLVIIGFKGDRERGIKMLWQASRFDNINGAMAGLIILGYYNGLLGFCDILPDSSHDNSDGYPKERCEALLAGMRSRYPKSRLWLLEEARMQAGNRRLEKAVEMLSANMDSPLKQVKALGIFEKSLNSMYLHQYELSAESFIQILKSKTSGTDFPILSRPEFVGIRQLTIPQKKHAVKAEELLKEVSQHAGKKRFMARQLPFDVFVVRKIQKWEHRAREWKVDFVDGVGVSPIEEMIYFWNGFKRMSPAHLDRSLDALAWSSSEQNPNWHREALDEKAILVLLRAATLRNMGQHSQARQLLSMEILNHDRALYKGHLKDDWTCPTAHYEMAANFWLERDGGKGDAERERQCAEWLDKVAKWEGYELDTRIGLKVTTAQDTLKKIGVAV